MHLLWLKPDKTSELSVSTINYRLPQHTHACPPPPPPPPPASWYCQIKLQSASHGNTISQPFASFSLCPGLSPPPTPMITCTNSIPFIVSSTNARNTVSSGSNPSFWCIQCLSFCCRWLVVFLINIYEVLTVTWVDSPVLIISGRWELKVIGAHLMNIYLDYQLIWWTLNI